MSVPLTRLVVPTTNRLSLVVRLRALNIPDTAGRRLYSLKRAKTKAPRPPVNPPTPAAPAAPAKPLNAKKTSRKVETAEMTETTDSTSTKTAGLSTGPTRIPRGAPVGPPLQPVTVRHAKTMIGYIKSVQDRFPSALVLTQVGTFMELYFDQATEWGPKLNLKVGTRQTTKALEGIDSVPIAGFPLSQKSRFEREIVMEWGTNVVTMMQDAEAIARELSEEQKRPIERILTPGTVISEEFIDSTRNNYLCCIQLPPRSGDDACAMWVDVASGDVHYEMAPLGTLGNVLSRISPREILMNSAIKPTNSNWDVLKEMFASYAPHATVTHYSFPTIDYWATRVRPYERYAIESLGKTSGLAYTALMAYLELCIPGADIELQTPQPFLASSVMQLDASARAALDLTSSSRADHSSSGIIVTSANSTGKAPKKPNRGTVLSTISRTVSASGTRLLQKWLMAPLQSVDRIRERQDRIDMCMNLPLNVVSEVTNLLKNMPDGARVIQKMRQNKGVNPIELVEFSDAIRAFQQLQHIICGKTLEHNTSLSKSSSTTSHTPRTKSAAVSLDVDSGHSSQAVWPAEWRSGLEQLSVDQIEFSDRIRAAIDVNLLRPTEADSQLDESSEGSAGGEKVRESQKPIQPKAKAKAKAKSPPSTAIGKYAPATSKDYKPVIRPETSPQLKKLHKRVKSFDEWEEAIVARLKQQYGDDVQLRWSPIYHYHVSIGKAKTVPEDLVLLKLKKGYYISDVEWSLLGVERLNWSSEVKEQEIHVLKELKEVALAVHAGTMRSIIDLGDEIDVHRSFAVLAREHNLIRPEIVEDPGVFEVTAGRHLAVERSLATGSATIVKQHFVANDCNLSSPQPLALISGPNMGGKSTYIRQNAIIVILAHMGSFVPADAARIGVVDRVFSRLGAGDDLVNGRSTFMVEMLETANILNNATQRSLAILDEVGRGTSSVDGTAIAYATVKYLTQEKKCRTLFASHYGQEIWKLVESDSDSELAKSIRLLQSGLFVQEKGIQKNLVFDYALKPGISESSYGLTIAELANFPKSALKDAKAVVNQNST